MDNSFLVAAFGTIIHSDQDWREMHDGVIRDAAGYLFHESRRACPVVLIAPGESNDTGWEGWKAEVTEEEEIRAAVNDRTLREQIAALHTVHGYESVCQGCWAPFPCPTLQLVQP